MLIVVCAIALSKNSHQLTAQPQSISALKDAAIVPLLPNTSASVISNTAPASKHGKQCANQHQPLPPYITPSATAIKAQPQLPHVNVPQLTATSIAISHQSIVPSVTG
jgi:hypothetical protein